MSLYTNKDLSQSGNSDSPATDPDDPLPPGRKKRDEEPLPLPSDVEQAPPAPVREPDTPPPAGDPKPLEPTRLV